MASVLIYTSSCSLATNTRFLQASGNFGAPITAALVQAGFDVTIISRAQSTATFPAGLPVLKVAYETEALARALQGQDAAVCAVGPAGIGHQTAMVDAAEAAGVRRFVVDDFGWGPDVRGWPEFAEVHAARRAQWDYARARAEANPAFTWTGISIGNPIDWVSFCFLFLFLFSTFKSLSSWLWLPSLHL